MMNRYFTSHLPFASSPSRPGVGDISATTPEQRRMFRVEGDTSMSTCGSGRGAVALNASRVHGERSPHRPRLFATGHHRATKIPHVTVNTAGCDVEPLTSTVVPHFAIFCELLRGPAFRSRRLPGFGAVF